MSNEFIMRVLRITSEVDYRECVWWRTDAKYAPVTFFVNCNDVFHWACADAEVLTEDNIALFEQTMREVHEMSKRYPANDFPSVCDAPELFVARVRKMRPQGASYRGYHRDLWPLFDACGPERDPKEHGNTPRPTVPA